jgi:hypothetical protein
MIFDYIDGYCDFSDYYKMSASQLVDGDIFVEVGVWKGKSLSLMAELIKHSNRNVTIYGVDTWQGSLNEEAHQKIVRDVGGEENFYLEFLKTFHAHKLLKHVVPIKLASIVAATIFRDESIQHLYLDASHTYEDVSADIKAWFPKIKVGGIMSGHDYYIGNAPSEPLIRAVDEAFPKITRYYGGVWEIRK